MSKGRADFQAGQLDNVPRRYAWFRRILKSHDEQDSPLFPESWQVTRLLIGSFSEYTRTDLGNVLGKGVPTVNVLLEALQGTLDFEGVMEKRLETDFEEIVEIGLPGQPGRGRWTISSVFDQHFSIYVDAQDRCVLFSIFFLVSSFLFPSCPPSFWPSSLHPAFFQCFPLPSSRTRVVDCGLSVVQSGIC